MHLKDVREYFGFQFTLHTPLPLKSTTPLRRNTRVESSTYAQDCAVREAVMLTLRGEKESNGGSFYAKT